MVNESRMNFNFTGIGLNVCEKKEKILGEKEGKTNFGRRESIKIS